MAAKPHAARRDDSPETGESLDGLLASITPENIHPETDFGPPRGEEEW